jgi:hypothetical protein
VSIIRNAITYVITGSGLVAQASDDLLMFVPVKQ